METERAAEADPALVALPGLLARATSVRPTKTWLRNIEDLVAGSEPAATLLTALLTSLTEIPFTPVPPTRDDPANVWLVSPGNAVLLRGCALAVRFVEADHVAGLCAPAAGAAIDTLGVRRDSGDEEARRQLGLLSHEITRRDLLKRVHAALAGAPVRKN